MEEAATVEVTGARRGRQGKDIIVARCLRYRGYEGGSGYDGWVRRQDGGLRGWVGAAPSRCL